MARGAGSCNQNLFGGRDWPPGLDNPLGSDLEIRVSH